VAGQTVRSAGQDGSPWRLEARALASPDDALRRQLLLVARQDG
jgi:hypothetical protein